MGIEDNVLVRKLRRGGIARSPLPDTEFVGQAFARQIEKAMRPLVKSPVSAMAIETRTVKVAEALQDVPVPAMLCLTGIDKAKSQGLLVIDTDLAYHLIDLMLGGDPALAPAPITRTFTAIDLALCHHAQEGILTAACEALGAAFGRPFGRQLTIAGQMQDITQVRFAPQHVDVLAFNVALDIGPAARSGKLHLFLPLAMLDVICAMMQDDQEVAVAEEEPTDLWHVQMRRAAAIAPVAVQAVLHRQRMSIEAAMALAPGDVIEVPAAAPSEIQLTIAQPGGARAVLAVGRLGAYRGGKVVKLETAVDRRVQDQIRRIL